VLGPIVLVVDSLTSALGISALMRARLNPQIRVIAALEHRTMFSLIKAIREVQPASVVFTWRFLLLDILKSRKAYARLRKIESKPYFGVLIADYLGRNPLFRFKEIMLLNSVDFYFATCKELAETYADESYKAIDSGLLYDFPNIDKTHVSFESENCAKDFTKVIWIGNSKWGKRQGYKDHKGYESVVQPLFGLLKQNYPKIELKTFDSAFHRHSNSEILKELGPSTILIQSSNSEGTGLPLLEALAMGSTPITTRVGIANEVLVGKFESLIVKRDFHDFFAKCEEIIGSKPHSPQEIRQIYVQHLEANLDFRIPSFDPSVDNSKLSKIDGRSFHIHCIWFIRYLLNVSRR
jgi:glycosyltransferase involved in cell wall biosynthesis